MLQANVSEEFKAFFLLKFTRELIRNSVTADIKLEIVDQGKKDSIKEKVKETLKKESEAKRYELSENSIEMKFEPSRMIESVHPVPMIKPQQRRQTQTSRQRPLVFKMPVIRPLRIPEPVLPPRLQYLSPTPTNKEIDLGKLNSLIKDPAVKTIQCDGADKNIVVMGAMGMKKTNIILSKSEIDEVLSKFYIGAKIPLQEDGIFRVVFGRLILSAIISKVISPRFIIRKMAYSSRFGQTQGRMDIIPHGVI